MGKRYIIAFIIALGILGLTNPYWLIYKSKSHAHFEFYVFTIILICGYLLALRLTEYLADFKTLKNQSRIEIIFLTIFFGMLFIPMSHIDRVSTRSYTENRNLAEYKPLLEKNYKINYNFGNDFNNWFNDRFFLRNLYINITDSKYFINKHIRTSRVVMGKENWLFYIADPLAMQSYQNSKQFDTIQLKKFAKYLSSINKYCNKNNKKFYFIIAPDKSKVYSEYYPDYIYKIKPDDKSRTNQLISYLNKHTDVKVIYPVESLLKNKTNEKLLYFKKDTHWNLLGAYYAYFGIINEIKKDKQNINIYNATNYINQEYYGDLYNMMPESLKNKKPDIYVVPDKSDMMHVCQKTKTDRDIQYCNNSSAEYNILVFRDSFFTSLIPYISESFRKSTYIWDYNVDYKQFEDADIIVLEIVERSMPKLVNYTWKGL